MSDKKKIGILTFHNAHNYGAVLQAYALKTKLNRMGYEASVLNYRNKYIAKTYRKVFHIDFWKRDILPSRWGKVLREVRDVFYGLPEWQRQWKVFENFITDKLLDGDGKVLSLEDVANRDCDVYILGSDQIWARELTHGMDPAYFGQFAAEKKKISYAASVPNGSIPENEKPYFKQYLQSLSHISVREEKLAEAVRELTGREVETVIDPTLLLESEDYQELLLEESLKQGDYVFAYFVVENEMLKQCAKKAAELLGCELIELHYKKTPEIQGESIILDAGPREFLTYIRDAKMVVTNSFHGTVFSILFQKKFYSVYKENGRIENLLGFLGLSDRHIQSESEIQLEKEIDYGQSEGRLQEYRQKSVEFLHRGIEELARSLSDETICGIIKRFKINAKRGTKMGEITLVTDFFDIGRGQDKNQELRKTSEKYLDAFKHWARIQNKLIVYTDSKSAKKVMEIRESFGRGEQTIIIEVDNLFELEGELFERMEKAAANPAFLDFRYLPEAFSNNPKYDYLWMMKYYFMNDAYNRGLLSDQVVWIDFGFDHGGLRYYSEDFDFKWEYDFGDKINIFCLYSPDSVLGIETLQYLDDCVEGSMHGLPRELVPTFWQLIRNAMEALLMLDCVDDDQLLVMMAYKARPDLFKVEVTEWQMALKLRGGDHMRVKPKRVYKQENKYKRMIRLAVRKFIPNKKDLKRLYAKRCYDTAVRFYGK